MSTLTLKHVAANDRPTWKSEAYRGKQMHVCAKRRPRGIGAPADGERQWDFTINITQPDGGPTAPASASAQSDPDLAYSTRAIAENMGFQRGRELIESE